MKKISSILFLFLFVFNQQAALKAVESSNESKKTFKTAIIGVAMVSSIVLAKKYPTITSIFVLISSGVTVCQIQKVIRRMINKESLEFKDVINFLIAGLFLDCIYYLDDQHRNNNRTSLTKIVISLIQKTRNVDYNNLDLETTNKLADTFEKLFRWPLLLILVNKLRPTNLLKDDFEFKPIKTNIKFNDVAGLDKVKEELEIILDFLKDPKKYEELGAQMPKGLLLTGDPGCGKTLIAKALAGEADCNFFTVSGPEFHCKWLGEGQIKIRQLFEVARKSAPSIIFIDEFDALANSREEAHRENKITLNQLLIELDGMNSNGQIFVIAATNLPDSLDQAAIRSGRFDRQIKIEKPESPEERLAILQLHTANVKLSPDIDLNAIAQDTENLTPADLKNIVNKAAIIAIKKNKQFVETEDFMQAIEELDHY